VTTGRHRTGRIDTSGRFSQYKSTLVRTEQNGSGRPSTNFECGAFNPANAWSDPGKVSGAALAAAFNAGSLPTGLPGRQRRAIDRTTPSCDKNDARRTGCSEAFRCGARVIRTRAAVGGSSALHRVGRAKPCQFLNRLPVIGANRGWRSVSRTERPTARAAVPADFRMSAASRPARLHPRIL